MDRNRTVVDAVIPPRQSNGARQRDTKAPCGYDSRKPVRPVGTVFFLEPVTNADPTVGNNLPTVGSGLKLTAVVACLHAAQHAQLSTTVNYGWQHTVMHLFRIMTHISTIISCVLTFNPFNASCSKLLLFEGSIAILV